MSVTDANYRERGLAVLAELGWIPDANTPGAPADHPDSVLWDYSIENLWGRIWARPGLTLRERQLASLAALVYLRDEPGLRSHLRHCQAVGLGAEQIRSMVVLVGHYAGWPSIEAAFRVLGEVAEEVPELATQTPLSVPASADSEYWFAAGLQTLSDLGWNNGPHDAEPPIKNSDRRFWNHTIEALFGRAYSVPGLTLKEKQLVVMATIIAHGNQIGIRTHYLRCHNAGVSELEVRELLLQVGYYTGWPSFSVGSIWFNQLLEEAGDTWPASMRTSLPAEGKASSTTDFSGPTNEGGSV